MHVDVAIVGGTGVGDRLLAQGGRPLHVPTAAGLLRGKLIQHEGCPILLVGRHAAGHKLAPHRVNYSAIALGLMQLGVKGCFSSAAVGSLRPEWVAGTLAACGDLLEMSARNLTLFDHSVVHTDFSTPFDPACRQNLLDAGADTGIHVEDGGVYVGTNGPRYETPAEIHAIRTIGGDVVGMTVSTEAIAMREAGVPYACLAVVTNAAAGISPAALSHEEVVDEMKRSGERAVKVLLRAAVRQAGG